MLNYIPLCLLLILDDEFSIYLNYIEDQISKAIVHLNQV